MNHEEMKAATEKMTTRSPFLESMVTLFGLTIDEDRRPRMEMLVNAAMMEGANNGLEAAHKQIFDHIVNRSDIRVSPELFQQVVDFIFWAANKIGDEQGQQTGVVLMARLKSAREATEAGREYVRRKMEQGK